MVEPLGNETLITVALGDELVNVRAAAGVEPADRQRRCGLAPDRTHLHLFDRDHRRARSPRRPQRRTPPSPPPTPEHRRPNRPSKEERCMSDHTTSERSSRSYTRRQIVKGALGTGAVLGLSPLASRLRRRLELVRQQRRRRRRRLDHDRQLLRPGDGAVP